MEQLRDFNISISDYQKNLISIIVPVYNIDPYLEDLVESVIRQTYKNWELILVDDGSTDSSGNICDQYANLYRNIITIHQINEGVSSARNFGITIAKGEFIAFVDGDDLLAPNYLRVLRDGFTTDDIQLSWVGYTQNYDELDPGNDIQKYQTIKSNQIVSSILDGHSYDTYLWNKLFLHKLIDLCKLRFNTSVSIWEDLLFVDQYLTDINNIALNPCKLYYYRRREQSAINTLTADKKKEKVIVCYEIMKNATLYNTQKKYVDTLLQKTLIDYLFTIRKNESFRVFGYHLKEVKFKILNLKEKLKYIDLVFRLKNGL